jgi:hypothetical protein
LELCERICAVLTFLRDKSRATAAILAAALNTYPSWEGSGVGRFMESPLSLLRMHWDHEPELHKSLNDE